MDSLQVSAIFLYFLGNPVIAVALLGLLIFLRSYISKLGEEAASATWKRGSRRRHDDPEA